MYRKLLTSVVFENPRLFKVWVWCLFRANWTDTKVLFEGNEINVTIGQFITGRFTGSKECKMPEGTFYKQLKKLELIGNITMKSDNKKTLITVVNYGTYQTSSGDEGQQKDNKGTTTGQQQDTDKNIRSKQWKKEDIQGVQTHWNAFATENNLRAIVKISPKREAGILSRFKESEFDLPKIFEEIRISDFLRGSTGWKVNFDFVFCSANNYLKILEGQYRNEILTIHNRQHETPRRSKAGGETTADDLRRTLALSLARRENKT